MDKRSIGYLALMGAIVGYGGLWPVTRKAIETIPPFWFASLRMWVGVMILVIVLFTTRRLRMPSRHDLPLILSIGFLMLAFYTTLMHLALLYVEAGRAALLGYTTPLWVLPAAYFLFRETPSRRKLIGMAIAMTGLIILFNPRAFNWSDSDVVLGNALLLLCALLWSVTIIHIRGHRPVLTPIQLAPFQLMISASFIGILALLFEPFPDVTSWTTAETGLFFYGATFGTALAMMSVTTCVRYLPTVVSTVGLLGAPVCALILSVFFLGEVLTLDLASGLILIIGGIAMVSVPKSRSKDVAQL
ncbi:MAG: DMT family transporter [Pseudomonadota bacterium]|nr:DMT family transporter [Pseudomonadota bacterium]